jgi:hypothetical protein
MNNKRTMGWLAALLVAAAFLGVDPASAQVAAQDGQQFVGKWNLAFEPMGPMAAGGGGARPGGAGGPGAGGAGGAGGGAGRPGGAGGGPGGAQVLDITVENGQLKAALTGGMGGAREITSITRDGTTLVLGYSMGMGGQTMPVTLRLTPDGSNLKAEMGNGQFTRTGTATKPQ